MRFLDLHIKGFGKFHDTSISFEDGLNVIYGKNEAGKSTVHTFIRSMLFGLEKKRGRAARTDTLSLYEPWEGDGAYEGSLRLESEGHIYRIERTFNKKNITIIDETAGLEVKDDKVVLDRILGGISETTYNNTISISQLKSATDDGMISELRNYIANLNTSGNMSLNITKATEHLKKEKKALSSKISPDAAKNYTTILSEIKELEEEVSAPMYENLLGPAMKRRETLKLDIEASQKEKESINTRVLHSKKTLEDYSFTDEKSIEEYENSAIRLFDELTAASKSYKKVPGAGVCLFLILVFSGLAGYAFALYRQSFQYLPAGYYAAGSIVALLPAIFFNSRKRHFYAIMNSAQEKLSAIMKLHTSTSDVSETNMTYFKSKMAKFKELARLEKLSEEQLRERTDFITDLLKQQNENSENIEQGQKTQWELEKKLERLNVLKTQAVALKSIIAENDRIRDEITAIELAAETLNSLSSTIRDSFGLYLNKTSSQLIGGITGGKYTSMSIDENFRAFLNTRKKLIPLEQVSGGTADQIYLALRLAAAKFIQKNEDRIPLVFDDSFVLYDDDRLKSALTWLPTAYTGQILVFTCHSREARVLKEAECEFNLIEL